METQELLVGGWSTYQTLTTEDQQVFDEALKGFVGVKYSPKEVSIQLVNGENYRFRSDASLPQNNVIWHAVVEIYAPIKGQPHIVSITRI